MGEIVQFIHYLDKNDLIPVDRYKIKEQYDELINMTMNNIKIHYLEILQRLSSDKWESIYQHFQNNRESKYKSNIYIATQDAHTLIDGPTIFLANDVEKISKFILQTTKIPAKILSDMTEAIEYNDKLSLLITDKEHKLEDSLGDEVEKEHKK